MLLSSPGNGPRKMGLGHTEAPVLVAVPGPMVMTRLAPSSGITAPDGSQEGCWECQEADTGQRRLQ